jgi:phosphatidylethanolamine-binding protein (PEBP) family uncharacterized protein
LTVFAPVGLGAVDHCAVTVCRLSSAADVGVTHGQGPDHGRPSKLPFTQIAANDRYPPPGEVHRYEFTVHALGTTLEINDTVSNALAGFIVNANSIASSSITAVYTR